MVGHDEFIEMLGAYALDAVDPDERRAIEAHLDICPTCQAEVLEHIEVAGVLSTQFPAAMPTGLWDRILEQIDAAPVDEAGRPLGLPRLSVFDTADPAPSPGDEDPAPTQPASAMPAATGITRDARQPGAPVEAAETARAVIPLDAARRARQPRHLATAALAVAAAIIMVVLASGLVRANQRENDLRNELARPAIDLAADRALADPTSTKYVLTSPATDARATAVVTATGEGFLVPHAMADLPPDRTYQLWEIGAAGPVSLGVMGSTPQTTAFHVHGPVPMLAITNEVAGGVPSPQSNPLMTATA